MSIISNTLSNIETRGTSGTDLIYELLGPFSVGFTLSKVKYPDLEQVFLETFYEESG